MKTIAACSVLLLAWMQPALATTLTFEDLAAAPLESPTGSTLKVMPGSYGGISWAANFAVLTTPQAEYSPHSGTVRIVNNGIHPGDSSFSFLSGPAVFDGAYFAGYEELTIKLYLGGSLVKTFGNTAQYDLDSTSRLLGSGYTNLVDRVQIIGQRGYYAFDDLSYHYLPAAQVPEADTYAMLLAGLGLMGAIARRRRQVQQ